MSANAWAWMSLVTAGLFEIGWPLGLKFAGMPGLRFIGFAMAAACMGCSGALLWYALKVIPIGTAYAVWTGLGAAGTFMVGTILFDDPNSLLRWLGCAFVVSGVVLLKMGS
jgi:quaternary ammonium compound-resistance protein SugE